jgi:hypothetical protein
MSEFLIPILFVHGLAHIVGFVGPWRLMDVEGVTYQSSLFDGRVQVDERTMRAIGIGWLTLSVGFVGTGVAATLGARWWSAAALVLALASFMMCAANWPAARIGASVNLALMAALQIGRLFHWM